jgi:hypothetical protein
MDAGRRRAAGRTVSRCVPGVTDWPTNVHDLVGHDGDQLPTLRASIIEQNRPRLSVPGGRRDRRIRGSSCGSLVREMILMARNDAPYLNARTSVAEGGNAPRLHGRGAIAVDRDAADGHRATSVAVDSQAIKVKRTNAVAPCGHATDGYTVDAVVAGSDAGHGHAGLGVRRT